jgi:hypothetical protein
MIRPLPLCKPPLVWQIPYRRVWQIPYSEINKTCRGCTQSLDSNRSGRFVFRSQSEIEVLANAV